MYAVIVSLVVFIISFGTLAYAGLYGSKLCQHHPNQLTCYVIKRGDTWQTLFPDPEKRDLVMRLNRMNINPARGTKIAVPINFNEFNLMTLAPFALQIEPPGTKVIFVSLEKLAWGAYDANGTLLLWGPVSGGRGYCPDIGRGCHTKIGKFEIYQKGGAGCVSTKYPVGRGGAPMPYCMFFNGGFALHGSHDVPGYHASHGCVRLFVKDAKWLNQEFVGDEDIPVIINTAPDGNI